MRPYIGISNCLIVGLLLITSCKKSFLDIVPKGTLVAETVEDYNLLMNGTRFYEYLQGAGWQGPLLMGDEMAAEANGINVLPVQAQRLFKWEAVIYNEKQGDRHMNRELTNLYALNKIINEVMSASGDEQKKKEILAEARASRAWSYFILINLYAKPYVAATAVTDAGFPIIKEAEINTKTFVRNSLQEVYDFIVADLTAAIPAIAVKPAVQTRMSKAAAEGLLGKVYLFMGKPTEALTQFNAAFEDLANTSVKLYDYNVELEAGGSFLPIGFYGPNSPGNNYNDFTEAILAKTFFAGANDYDGFGSAGLVLTPATVALYTPEDYRLQFYAANYSDGSPNPDGRLRKYGVQYAKFGLQLSELYLLRAEAKARTNDLTGAVSDVEVLRTHRIERAAAAVPPVATGDKTALIKFIMEERIREFAGEGYRWFDMRRISVDPLFMPYSASHILYEANGSQTIFTLRPERLVLRFPPNITTANPEMPDNP